MKTISQFIAVLLSSIIGITSCSADFLADGAKSDLAFGESPEGGNGNGSNAGVITAGEWNDLDNWDFWNELINGQTHEEYYGYIQHWGLYTDGRFPITVLDTEDKPVCGATVELFADGAEQPVWTAVSDNNGSAELWYGICSENKNTGSHTFTVKVNGSIVAEPVSPATMNTIRVTDAPDPKKSVDIAFIVDATGSMGDEITFLKDDLMNILNQVMASQSDKSFRTAALFYRDEKDEYLTRYENFSSNPASTLDFIKKQQAMGGGDYPEAVHTALENAIQSLSWEEGNYARLAFLILDAPPHHTDKILDSIHSSIGLYASKGIKIIPVAASGVDKSTEFLLRLMAMMTDGTYVFITNDSGVGNDHIIPTVGAYQVEHLNALMIRLIEKYSE